MTATTTTLIEISLDAYAALLACRPPFQPQSFTRTILDLHKLALAARRLRTNATQGVSNNPHAWEDLFQALDHLEGKK